MSSHLAMLLDNMICSICWLKTALSDFWPAFCGRLHPHLHRHWDNSKLFAKSISDRDADGFWVADCLCESAVGILAAQCAHIRGAKQIIMIDNQQYRLDFAKSKLPYLELLNFDDTKDVVKSLKERTGHGPDVCIEAVGFHYTKTLADKIQMALMLETDPASMLNEMILACKKRGRLSIVSASQLYVFAKNVLWVGTLFLVC